MIRLQPGEQRALSSYIHSISAITLDESKAYLIEGRLGSLAGDLGCGSFGELLAHAQSDATGAVRRRIIDAITTGETLFFRDTAPFDLLRHKIVPELIDQRSRGGIRAPLRIWSAACSTGQEVYSIAITLHELLRGSAHQGVQLLGTDISGQAVARASRGIYNSVEIGRGLTDQMLAVYFRRTGDGWQIRDEIRAMASFKTLNLMSDFSGLGRFDVIFCRNVAIYFADRDRSSLFQRLERSLERHGYLVVGSMESLTGICPSLESRRHLRTVYYQPKAAPTLAAR